MESLEKKLRPVFLNVRDLDEAWHMALKHCFMYGYEWLVKSGSYAGQKRFEFDSFDAMIHESGKGPLVPIMPEGTGLIPPTSKEYVENYFARYLMSDAKTEHEDYTYGERLVNPRFRFVEREEREDEPVVKDGPLMNVNQVEVIIKELIHSGGSSNQTCMEIGMPNDVLLKDPPCCRLIDTRIRYGKLHFFIYFRSWDLYGGFPANLGGMELLKQYMVNRLNEEGLKVGNGSMKVSSKGLHIYEQYYPVVEQRFGMKKEELRKMGEKDPRSIIVYDSIKEK